MTDLSYRIPELEILTYDNAETWFTKTWSILQGKKYWQPIHDILVIRGNESLPEAIEENLNQFYSPVDPRYSSPPPTRFTTSAETTERILLGTKEECGN
jgi:hypothetical protein